MQGAAAKSPKRRHGVLRYNPPMKTRTEQWLVAALITAVVAVMLWFAWSRYSVEDPVVDQPAAPAADAVPADATPRHPVRPPIDSAPSDASRHVPLPALDDSDRFFKLELGGLFGPGLDELLANEAVIEKVVVTIDNLPRSKLAERMRPVSAAPGAFIAEGTADDGDLRISEDNYARYESLVALLTSTGTDDIAELYRRYYPLMQEAYEGLGYPDAYFNDRVVEVIDHLLDAPTPAEAPALARPHVLFQYADPELESLSVGHKLLIRIGPANAVAVKAKLSDLRDRLARAP